jgi:hypothetical protein
MRRAFMLPAGNACATVLNAMPPSQKHLLYQQLKSYSCTSATTRKAA